MTKAGPALVTFTHEHIEEILAAEKQDRLNGTESCAAPLETPAVVSSWTPVKLDAILAGTYEPDQPTMLKRSDGHALMYPGRIHAWNAEPESLKTYLMLLACSEAITAGEVALFIDFEDSAASVVGRLLGFGITAEQIRELFIYIRPDEPLADVSLRELDAALSRGPVLVVIDGLTEAFTTQGLNPLDNVDIATWLEVLPRRCARAGAATNLLDHVVKDREQRGRYAIGGQHKLAGVDVAYGLKVIEPFGRGRDGTVSIRVHKDRPGSVRAFAADGQIAAILHAHSLDGGAVHLTLDPPDSADRFRPTGYMERVSLVIESNPGLSKRGIREAVTGKAEIIDKALEVLTAEGFTRAVRVGQAIKHESINPYREADDEPTVSQPCPGHTTMTVSPCPAP